MKNPLRKRYIRELKSDFGKYLVIFLFMIALIGMVSGFLIADNNFYNSYNEGFEKYNVEDGHLAFSKEPSDELLKSLEDKAGLKFYELFYFEETEEKTGANIRTYIDRDVVNTECVMEGRMPSFENEIAIDRMFADNHSIKIGNTITLRGKELTVTGFTAVPDYSSLFESNTDMLFDAVNFSVAFMTKEGFEAVESRHLSYNYAWKYNAKPADDVEANKFSEDFLEVLEDVLLEYNEDYVMDKVEPLFNGEIPEDISVEACLELISLFSEQSEDDIDYEKVLSLLGIDRSELIDITDYVPGYANNAIIFTGEDMGSDATMFLIFCYIVVAILAFVFAVTTSNTITKEAGVIGTLRATGYSRGALVAHYLTLPVIVTVLAAIIGNILGYTVFKDYFVSIYYSMYSLATYEDIFNSEAFINTTVVPVILMLVINFLVLSSKMKISPLKFIRHDLSTGKKKKAFRLNRKIPFIHRFRLRVFFQNIPGYITLFCGIFLGGMIIIFGTMFGPLLSDYSTLVSESRIADYQYVLMKQVETDNAQAEKYCMTSLDYTKPGYVTDGISVFGISKHSKYLSASLPENEVLISNCFAEKYRLKAGDELTLSDHFSSKTYTVKIGGIYNYDAGLAVFMNRSDYIKLFNESSNYFTGYFSNEKLTDINDDDVATILTGSDFKKMADQMMHSFGDMLALFNVFGTMMFVLLMYLMTKQIIEKNMVSISMTKILGFKKNEIRMLYLTITSIVVVISLLACIPLVDLFLRWIFSSYLYTVITGYIPYIISPSSYITMFVLGIASYIFVSLLMMLKINKIPKSEALKNVL